MSETLQGRSGPICVDFMSLRPQTEAVANIEVLGAHVYQVSSAGILVHNASNPCVANRHTSGKTLNPVLDPARPPYKRGHAGQPVVDHVKARAAGGHPTDPSNLDLKPWEWNARKGAYEGQLLKAKREYMEQFIKHGMAESDAARN